MATVRPEADQVGVLAPHQLRERLHQHLKAALAAQRGVRLKEDDLRIELSRVAEQPIDDQGHTLDYATQQQVVQETLSEVFGYGPIEGLIQDHEITDILINGPRQIYYERRGKLQTTDLAFRDDAHFLEFIGRMLAGSGKRLDATIRMADARLPDGSRLNVVLNPPALNGPLVSIRRVGARPLLAEDLLANESLTQEMLEFLSTCVKLRINLIVSGGTGTGKTTLLNALSRFIPESERIVTIEDTAEMQLQQRHVAKMESQTTGAGGEPEVTMRDLVKNSLRMRPDRVVVGECRGVEVLDMLQAMNTGHEGSMTTVHANDPREALARIELMVALSGTDIQTWAVRRLVATSVNLIVQVARLAGGRRKVVNISEITGMEGDIVSMHTLFEFVQTGVDNELATVGHFRATGIRPHFLKKLQARGANLKPELFAERVLRVQKSRGPIQ
jgi:pilus assembly protein CpaF